MSMDAVRSSDAGLDLISLAREFNAAWNSGDVDTIMRFFADDANVRIVPPPAPPAPEVYTGHAAIRAWVEQTLAQPFQVIAENYRTAGSVVTWDTTFPLEPEGGSDRVAEAVFERGRIVDFIP
jgi:hypothetical protein